MLISHHISLSSLNGIFLYINESSLTKRFFCIICIFIIVKLFLSVETFLHVQQTVVLRKTVKKIADEIAALLQTLVSYCRHMRHTEV
jgi:hypothetical protein